MTASSRLLATLVEEARAETAARREAVPEHRLQALANAQGAARDFVSALRRPSGLAVIAEMKRRTPLMGLLAEEYSPAALAGLYTRAGASAISVLCQGKSFGGHPQHLAEARAATGLPLMRKDFISDEYQVLEARAFGADAVLLIAGALDSGRLRELLAVVRRHGMEALVEIHDEAEAQMAVAAGARAVGVNHRDLNTFTVDTSLTARLRHLIPAELVLVAESGIHSAADARRMLEAGAGAILVGEALMRSEDPGAKLAELSLR